jgi:protein gp37
MSAIEWTDETWNPVLGCTPVSEGCRNCYAAKEANRLAGNPNPKISLPYAGLAEMRGAADRRRPVFTGALSFMHDRLEQPLRWRKPRRVFVNSMSDLFHPDVPDEFIDRMFAVMALTPRHTYQVLTKRPDRMADYMNDAEVRGRWGDAAAALSRDYAEIVHPVLRRAYGLDDDPRLRIGDFETLAWEEAAAGDFPVFNVWLGTSVEDQAAADQRVPHLLRTPAAVRFLSCEPLLGPVDLRRVGREGRGDDFDTLLGWRTSYGYKARTPDECSNRVSSVQHGRVDWVIVGGESGPGARRCDVAWVRSIVRQCQDAGTAVFVKQLGARPVDSVIRWVDPDGHALGTIHDRKGGDMAEWPADLRVREWPTTPQV